MICDVTIRIEIEVHSPTLSEKQVKAIMLQKLNFDEYLFCCEIGEKTHNVLIRSKKIYLENGDK